VSVNFTESSIRLRRRLAPPPPKPRNGQEAGGAGFRRAIRARNGDSTAPFAPESQSFLDHLVAGFRPNGSWSDPRRAQCQGPMEPVLRQARIRHIAVRILYAQPATMVSRLPFPALGGVSTFPTLAARGPVSGEEYRTSRTEGHEFRVESLLGDFSISEIWVGSRPETGCVSAETGSNLQSVEIRGTGEAFARVESATIRSFLHILKPRECAHYYKHAGYAAI
jgi:hypothetical protein